MPPPYLNRVEASQENGYSVVMSRKKTVSLVLGSGGARGLAHIGVIDELNHNGYDIKAIAGSSMGALIGGIYAMGKLDIYARWVSEVSKTDVVRLLDLSFGRNGLFKGDRIIAMLKTLTGDANIEDLPIPFTAVATDLETEKEVRFNHGPLFDAIRASIAIPTIFTPHRYNGREYLDGSLTNPLPVSVMKDVSNDLTIAVTVNGKPDPAGKPEPVKSPVKRRHSNKYQRRIAQFIDELRPRPGQRMEETLGLFDIVVKSMGIMENTITDAQLKINVPDILIEIPRDTCNFYEFYRAKELIKIGRQKAAAMVSSHQSLSA